MLRVETTRPGARYVTGYARNPPKSSSFLLISLLVRLEVDTDVQLTDPEKESISTGFSENVTEIVEYKPPGPPPKTGKHRYVFAALAPKNGTTAKLNLTTPKDRQHWGYKKERHGLRDWAKENGLAVVGMYALAPRQPA